MFTVEQFEGLEAGDLVETVALFEGLSDEKVVLHTQPVEPGSNRREFVATYQGVTLGNFVCVREGDTIKWPQ